MDKSMIFCPFSLRKQAFDEAVAKINKDIIIEVDAAKKVILEEAKAPKIPIKTEMDVRIRETNSEINKYNEQRCILKRQRNSLGLFKGKQKAELKNQINMLIAKIDSLPTEESIRDEYQTKFNKIDMDAKTKILETEKKIKEKYVMPKLEDFDRE